MNDGGFFGHQNKTSDTDRYKRFFSPLINVNTTSRVFEQRSELQVAKCLIVNVPSRSKNVSSLELRNKKKATQHWSLRVTNDIVLSWVRVYRESLYADNVVS